MSQQGCQEESINQQPEEQTLPESCTEVEASGDESPVRCKGFGKRFHHRGHGHHAVKRCHRFGKKPEASGCNFSKDIESHRGNHGPHGHHGGHHQGCKYASGHRGHHHGCKYASGHRGHHVHRGGPHFHRHRGPHVHHDHGHHYCQRVKSCEEAGIERSCQYKH